jgi:hypothetical protein
MAAKVGSIDCMLTLPSSLAANVAKRDTRPGYLVEINFSSPWRRSTLGERQWNGLTWAEEHVEVSGLVWEGRAGQEGSLSIRNSGFAFGQQCLAEPPSERSCNVWLAYGWNGAIPVGEVRHVFSGVVNTCQIRADRVTLTLKSDGLQRGWSPRRFITQSTGFTQLIAGGSLFVVGNETFRIDRGQE